MTDLFDAKVQVIVAFAQGPGVMLQTQDERDDRIASLLALVEMEFENTIAIRTSSASIQVTRPNSNQSFGSPLDASTEKIRWNDLIDWVRSHPGREQIIKYDKHHTAIVTASRQRALFTDIDFLVEKDGQSGVLTIITK